MAVLPGIWKAIERVHDDTDHPTRIQSGHRLEERSVQIHLLLVIHRELARWILSEQHTVALNIGTDERSISFICHEDRLLIERMHVGHTQKTVMTEGISLKGSDKF